MKTIDIFKTFLDAKKDINQTTLKGLKGNFRVWGSKLPKNVKDIDKIAIEKWINLIRKNLAPETQAKVVSNVRMAFELSGYNFFTNIKTDPRKAADVDPFSKDEVKVLLEKSEGKMRDFIGISLFTGMRGGEVMALQKEDIDLDKMTIRVHKSVSDGLLHKCTKNGKERTIPLFKDALPYIKNRIEKNKKWFFDNGRGDYYHNVDSFITNQKWKKFLKECKIKYRPPRQTRHTFATSMIDKSFRENFSLMWVSYILGHSNLMTTLKVYNRHIQGEHLKLNRDLKIY